VTSTWVTGIVDAATTSSISHGEMPGSTRSRSPARRSSSVVVW
jgi:hypothetical protein